MTQEQTTTLTAISSEVLANLAFMFSDDDEDAVAAADRTRLEPEIGYAGPLSRRLR